MSRMHQSGWVWTAGAYLSPADDSGCWFYSGSPPPAGSGAEAYPSSWGAPRGSDWTGPLPSWHRRGPPHGRKWQKAGGKTKSKHSESAAYLWEQIKRWILGRFLPVYLFTDKVKKKTRYNEFIITVTNNNNNLKINRKGGEKDKNVQELYERIIKDLTHAH